MEITYKARSYFIEKIEQETEESLAARAWFIIKLLDPTVGIDRGANPTSTNVLNRKTTSTVTPVETTFDEAVLLSKYWYYVRKYDCKYAQTIMEKISQTEKLLYV